MANFKPITEEAFRAALRPGPPDHQKAVDARFDRSNHRVVIRLADGSDFTFDPDRAYGLQSASDSELADVKVEGVGGTLSFPKLDAFFSVEGLLDGRFGPAGWSPSATENEEGKKRLAAAE